MTKTAAPGCLRRLWRSEHLAAYALIAPALLVLAVYVCVPIGYTVYISFQDVHLDTGTYATGAPAATASGMPNAGISQTFFGTKNWNQLLFHDPIFVQAVRNTLVMVTGATLAGTVLALAAAVLVTRRLPFMGMLRTLYFFPAALSQVVTGVVFLWLFDENFGLVNHLLGAVGSGPLLWQDDARYLLLSLTIAAAWILSSYNLPIFAAALQNVPQAQREAAVIDGAGPGGVFYHVVLPALRPVTWFVSLSSVVAVSQMLGLYDALGQDAVQSSTVVKYMFARAFYYNDIDYAGAIGCLMIVALTLLALIQLWLTERGEQR